MRHEPISTPIITAETKPAEVRALTIRQPWAWCICHAGKDIENRTWNTHHRGPLLIHAAVGCTRGEYARICSDLLRLNVAVDHDSIELGAVVAVAELADVIYPGGAQDRHSDPAAGDATCDGGPAEEPWYEETHPLAGSPWYNGVYGFVLRRVQALRMPVPCQGHQKMWRPAPWLLERVREQLP